MNLSFFMRDGADLSFNSFNQSPINNVNGVHQLPFNIFSNNMPTDSNIDKSNIIKENEDGVVNTMVNSNDSYIHSYAPVLDELNELNIETKEFTNELKNDINEIRSKNSRNKYNNLSAMVASLTSLTSTRLAIVKEAGNIINNSHKLDLSRHKQNIAVSDSQNDDAQVMELYNMITSNNHSSMTGGTILQNTNNMIEPNNEDINAINQLYSEYMDNTRDLSHTIVVVYNDASGSMNFAAIDENNNLVQSSNLPDNNLLSNLVLDRRNMIAKDSKLGIRYPLIIENTSVNDETIDLSDF